MAPDLHEFLFRLKALFQKRRLDRDMAEELEFHRAMLREKLLREGTAQADVEAATHRAFGNSRRWHERLRELWQFPVLEHLIRDVSFSARLLWKSPGFTTVAVVTLALGIGANTAIFSLVNGLLLRPLNVPHSEQLALLRIERGGPRPMYSMGSPFFRGLESRHEIFTDVFAFDHADLQVRGVSGNEAVDGQFVSGEFFRALQTPLLMGRWLTTEDDRGEGDLAVVISEGFWKRWFNGAQDVLGRKLQIDNTMFTVAGVMPKRFTGADPTQRPEIYVPLGAEAIVNGPDSMTAAGFHGWWLRVMGRLRPGVTLEQANAALLALSMPIVRAEVPDAGWVADAEKDHFRFRAEEGSQGFTYLRILFLKPLVAVFVMCGGILLLACLNLACLLLARSAARERELATRLALGASRQRLLQQLLIESLLIALMGTMAGLAAAPAVSKTLAAILLRGNGPLGSVYLDTSLDVRVLAFAALIAVTATLLIGLLPALQATSGSLNEQIKQGQQTRTTQEQHRMLPRVLMALEVALALMLVVGAGLLAESLVRLYRSGAGFDPHGVVQIAFDMDKAQLKGDALARFYQQVGEGLRHQPGVQSVSFSQITPLSGSGWNEAFSVPGGKEQVLNLNSIGPDYFQTMRIPMFEGRDFGWNDTKASGAKIILNQAAAKLVFPKGDAIGRQLVYVDPSSKSKTTYTVIGVVGNAKYYELRETSTRVGYVFVAQHDALSYSAVVRVEGSAGPLAAAARSLAKRLVPDIPAPVMTTMSNVLEDSIRSERLMAILSVYFAACAVLVTAIGLYGTLAYATARRTSEIGIRMALGAGRMQVAGMVFRENMVIALTGAVAGLTVAILASHALTSFLYGTTTHDPWVLGGSLAVLSVIAGAASFLPAFRAARIEPMAAIRCE
jgi:predicted permease